MLMEPDGFLPDPGLETSGPFRCQLNVWHLFREVALSPERMSIKAVSIDFQLVGILGGQGGDTVLQRGKIQAYEEPAFRSPETGLDELAIFGIGRDGLEVRIR